MTFLARNTQLPDQKWVVRSETDATVISNLLRKGWSAVPQPTFDANTETVEWSKDSGSWNVSPIVKQTEEAIPDWAGRLIQSLGSKAGLTDADIKAVVADAKSVSSASADVSPVVAVKP